LKTGIHFFDGFLHRPSQWAQIPLASFRRCIDFASRLDRAVEASNRAKLIEGRVIDSVSE
jgi:hypothetical protein